MRRIRATSESEEKSFWLQARAFEILQADLLKRKAFPSGLISYYALAAVAGETNSEPGPESDGCPFEVSIARLAQMTNQPVALVLARLKDFDRLGLIDPPLRPSHAFEPLLFRLRTLPDTEPRPGGGKL